MPTPAFPLLRWSLVLVILWLGMACGDSSPAPIRASLAAQSTDAEIAAFQTKLAEVGIDVGLNELVRHPAGHIERITLTFVCDPNHPTQVRADSLTVGDTIYFRRRGGNTEAPPCEAGVRRAAN